MRRFHPVNEAFVSPVLVWGCERLPLMVGWGLCATVVCPTAFQFVWLDVGALTFLPMWYLVCRTMAKRDPRMTQKVLEHMQWEDYYLTHGVSEIEPESERRRIWKRKLMARVVGALYS
ncbi:hypothetical protein EPN44_14410 [bacterium]|nr:MAG: hypothetical protein EPN44_14410 [bacterium]